MKKKTIILAFRFVIFNELVPFLDFICPFSLV